MKKYIKYILITILILLILAILIYNLLPQKVAVLTYHDFVLSNPENNMQISLSNFEEEMKYLHDHNYKTLTIDEFYSYINGEINIPKKSVLITFDDGWKNSLEAIKILKKYNLNATIFYIGSNLNNENFMNLDDLEYIKNNYSNITIASHSYDLHHDDSYLKDYDYLNNDFLKMKEIVNTNYFAYPYGLSSDNYVKVLKDNNYKLAFTFGPNKEHKKASKNDDKYKIPRLNFSTNMSLIKFIIRLKLPY